MKEGNIARYDMYDLNMQEKALKRQLKENQEKVINTLERTLKELLKNQDEFPEKIEDFEKTKQNIEGLIKKAKEKFKEI